MKFPCLQHQEQPLGGRGVKARCLVRPRWSPRARIRRQTRRKNEVSWEYGRIIWTNIWDNCIYIYTYIYTHIYIVNMCLFINSDSNIYQVNKDNDSSIPNQINIYSCVKRWDLHPKTRQQLLMGKGMINQCMEWGIGIPIPTVDGRNPAPVDRWFIPLFIGFQPSKVVQDFFHPQYFQTNPFVRFVCKSHGQASKIVEHAGKQTRKTNKKEHI